MRWWKLKLRALRSGSSYADLDLDAGLAAAAEWLKRAQDATDDDGVCAYYDARSRKWAGSYPETTGYIIPTLYRYAKCVQLPEYRERATRMAHWEAAVQLADGGVRAGTLDASEAVPTVFNTGQVLFGWAAALEETGDRVFEESLRRAAEWLIAAQDADGAWRRFGSPFASHSINAYNTRSAFGLAVAGAMLGEGRYLDAAKANIDWALKHAEDNRWLPDNDLEDNARPLTHTIAYAIRGILEVGVIAKVDQYVDAADAMASSVAKAQWPEGALPGRLDREWHEAVSWTCVTGNAQMAIIWLRLAEIKGRAQSRDCAERANRFNLLIQDNDAMDPGMRGGMSGSYPLSGGYMTRRYPNWATKFFMDALMLEKGFGGGG